MTPVRLGSALGAAIAALAAIWWFSALQFALANRFDASPASVELLNGLWLARALVIALAIPALNQQARAQESTMAAAAVVLGPLPLIVLAGAASGLAWGQVVLAEGKLLLLAGAATLLGIALRRGIHRSLRAMPAAFALGMVLVAAIWALRSFLVPSWTV